MMSRHNCKWQFHGSVRENSLSWHYPEGTGDDEVFRCTVDPDGSDVLTLLHTEHHLAPISQAKAARAAAFSSKASVPAGMDASDAGTSSAASSSDAQPFANAHLVVEPPEQV